MEGVVPKQNTNAPASAEASFSLVCRPAESLDSYKSPSRKPSPLRLNEPRFISLSCNLAQDGRVKGGVRSLATGLVQSPCADMASISSLQFNGPDVSSTLAAASIALSLPSSLPSTARQWAIVQACVLIAVEWFVRWSLPLPSSCVSWPQTSRLWRSV